MTSISFHPILGSWLLYALFILLLASVFIFFAPDRQKFSPFRRRFLWAIRFLTLLIFAVILTRPSMILEEHHHLLASLAVLIDSSESMGITDEAEGKSRFETVAKCLEENSSKWKSIQKNFDLEVLEFDEKLHSLSIDEGRFSMSSVPQGEFTSMGNALETLLSQNSGSRFLGAILFSDGTQRSSSSKDKLPEDAALRFREAQVPIYSFGVGSKENIQARRDIQLVDLIAPDRVFLQNELAVSGRIRAIGYAGKSVPVAFFFETPEGKMERILQKEVKIETEDQMIPYRFTYRPEMLGEWKISVAFPPQEGELLSDNNHRSSFVRVVDGNVNVLFLEGSRRFEDKFIRKALDSSSEIHIDYWRIASDPQIKPEGKTETERIAMMTASRPSLVENVFQKKDYSAFILGNIDVTSFKKEELTEIQKRVANGTGLIALGGDRSLSAGGYADSPLADVFPVSLNPSLRFPIDVDFETYAKMTKPEERFYQEGSFRVKPAEGEEENYLTQLSLNGEKNREIWSALPPLDSFLRLDSLKPGAALIAEAEPTDGGKTLPFLAAHLYGLGRVAVLGSDSTWKWGMAGHSDEFQRFWRQLVLWSVGLDELRPGSMMIQLDQTAFAENESVSFRVLYHPKAENSFDSLRPEATVTGPQGHSAQVLLSPNEDQSFSGIFSRTEAAGDYRIEVAMKDQNGNLLQEESSRFLVWHFHRELEDPIASPETLKNLSEISGGKFLSLSELPQLLDDLAQQKDAMVDIRQTRQTLYDSWLIFGGIVFLLSLEWFLRKRWGMV